MKLYIYLFAVAALLCSFAQHTLAQNTALENVLPRTVKIYGTGGMRGFEGYQSGLLVSPNGLVLTVAGAVLEDEPIVCVLNNGLRYEAKFVGMDPIMDMALLDLGQPTPDYFDIGLTEKNPVEMTPAETSGDSSNVSQNNAKSDDSASVGDSILAFSNLYGTASGNEPFSVQHGTISAKIPLNARRGAFLAGYKGPVYIIDAITNNPGAAGGALTDYQGRLVGVLGKQLKSTRQSVWLNYAYPVEAVQESIARIHSPSTQNEESEVEVAVENAWSLDKLGIRLIPDVLPRTPVYVDHVYSGSPADKAGIQPDDLILAVNGPVVRFIAQVRECLLNYDTADPLEVLIQRGDTIFPVVITR